MDIEYTKGLYSLEFIKPLTFAFRYLNSCGIIFFDDHVPRHKMYLMHFFVFTCILLHYMTLFANVVENSLAETRDLAKLVKAGPIIVIVAQSFFNTSMCGSILNLFTSFFESILRRYILHQDYELVLPYTCTYPFDPTKTFFRYCLVYTFQAFSMVTCTLIFVGSMFLIVAICSHLITEFTLLREDVLHLKPVINNTKAEMEGDHCGLGINDFIKRHQKLLNLSRDFDDIFNVINFVILLFATVITCFFAFAGKVSTGSSMIANIVAVMGMLVGLFVICYFGQMLEEESAGIALSAYENPWYKGKVDYQKTIGFIIARSQKPCFLTSLKYSPINLSTFRKVLSTTWSYFTLVQNVYEDV